MNKYLGAEIGLVATFTLKTERKYILGFWGGILSEIIAPRRLGRNKNTSINLHILKALLVLLLLSGINHQCGV